MILVTGAAGNTGSEVVRQLAAKGIRARALIRNPEKAKLFTGPGVETVVADLEKPTTLDAALKGVDKVFLVSSVDPRVGQLHGNLIESAKRSGVKQIVRLSAISASPSSPVQFLKWHGEVDERLSRSGLSYAILRPSFYMQNLFFFRGSIQSDGAMYGCFKEGKLAPIDTRDVALVATAVLTSEGHSGRVYELTGPESIPFAKIAESVGRGLGRKVAYVDVPPEAARANAAAAGWPAWLADGFVELMNFFATGGAEAVNGTMEKLTGKKPRTVETFAKDFTPLFSGKVGADT